MDHICATQCSFVVAAVILFRGNIFRIDFARAFRTSQPLLHCVITLISFVLPLLPLYLYLMCGCQRWHEMPLDFRGLFKRLLMILHSYWQDRLMPLLP